MDLLSTMGTLSEHYRKWARADATMAVGEEQSLHGCRNVSKLSCLLEFGPATQYFNLLISIYTGVRFSLACHSWP